MLQTLTSQPYQVKTLMSLDKTQVQFFKSSTLGSLIKFKHMVALINKIQTKLSFSRIFKFNVFEFNQEPNVFDLKNYI